MKDKKKKTDYDNSQEDQMLPTVGDIASRGVVMPPDAMATAAYEMMEREADCTEISIVDEENYFTGLLTKTDMMHAFGGRYGFSLHQRNHVSDLTAGHTLIVDKNFSIENVSRLAMERSSKELYDPIVVLEQGKYYGIVTIRDLLTTTVSIQVEKANESNPLTSLPGNKMIDKKIHKLIGEKRFFAIMYLDLDNFKAYNDAYGFPNGDRMIENLANVMRHTYEEDAFLGHIGGDDFVIITRQPDVRPRAQQIIKEFKKKLENLYHEKDWKRGYIVAHNRKGQEERFPIASVSIAIITNERHRYNHMLELTEQIVTAKKKAKQMEGNSIIIL